MPIKEKYLKIKFIIEYILIASTLYVEHSNEYKPSITLRRSKFE